LETPKNSINKDFKTKERNIRYFAKLIRISINTIHLMKSKLAKESYTVSSEIVLPNDTNTLGNLMGGRLLHWMDIAAAISAHRHCRRVVVTASVNNVSFDRPIRLADTVTIEAQVSRAFTSAMEVFIDVWVENHTTGVKEKCNEAIYTFVAVDQLGNPIHVPELIPETELEKKRYEGALRRRQLSLILAGKLKPTDATELKALFMPD
jgi:acyl-CoA hydrolase